MKMGQEKSGGIPRLLTFSHFKKVERESSRKMMMMVMEEDEFGAKLSEKW